MAFVITVATPKGGSGKSTLLCNMAAMFSAIGYSTAVLDTDTDSEQASAANWIMTRRGADVSQVNLVMVRKGETVEQTIARVRSDPSVDVLLVDVSGRDSGLNRMALKNSDAWVVPVKPTQNDLARMPYVQEMSEALSLERPDIITHLVINEAPTTNRIELKNALAFLADLGIDPMPTVIHARKAYRDCISEGLGVVELPANTGGKASDEFTEFFTELMRDYQPLLSKYLIKSDNRMEQAHGI